MNNCLFYQKFFLKILLCFLIVIHSANAEEGIVNIYTWSGYLSESVIKQFEKETGIRVNYSTYVSNEVLYAKLKANPHAGYDIIIPSTYFISRMVKQGLVQKLDKSKIHGLQNIYPNFLKIEHDPENAYSVPYLWGSTGIVINKKYHSVENITSWKDLWNARYRDQLLVLDDTREVFSMALMTLGYSVNDRNPEHIKKAFEKLKALMKNIKLFNTDAQRSIYLDEDITIGMGLSGDVYLARQENPNLHYAYPKEGFLVSLDCIAIPQGAKHVENAHRFINFVLRPDIAKQISLESGFSSANLAAVKLLPREIRQNPILYPNLHLMNQAKFVVDVGDAAPIYEKYFERLKLEE